MNEPDTIHESPGLRQRLSAANGMEPNARENSDHSSSKAAILAPLYSGIRFTVNIDFPMLSAEHI